VGTFSEWLENRTIPNEPFINALGDKICIGNKPRALIMCEESGGSVFGGTEFLMNESGSAGLIALREKDGFQFSLMTLSLAAHLYNSNRSFADYYCSLIEEHNIQNRFFNRKDVRLYDESLTGPAREKAKSNGEKKRDKVMDFYRELAKEASSGKSLDEVHDKINSLLDKGDKAIPKPKRVCVVGEGKLLEGTFMEFDNFWFLIRASGTDALLRYYIEGKDKDEIKAYQQSFINLRI
jgi:phosphomannomutase